MIRPDTELSAVPFLLPKEVLSLASAGLRSVGELLDWFPRRYEDRRRFDAFPASPGGPAACVRGTVIDTPNRFGAPARFAEAVVADTGGAGLGPATVTCRWFNMPFLRNVIATGQEVILHGKPKEFQGRIYIDHPDFEVIREDGGPSIHLERIVPIYRNVSGIAQRRLREIQHRLLDETDPASLGAPYDVDPAFPRAE